MDLKLKQELARLRVAEHRRKIKERAVQYKGGKCERCGYCKCLVALDFHHRDPTKKELRISKGDSRSFERIKKELDKCELVCANCHREIHDELRQKLIEKQRMKIEKYRRQEAEELTCSNCGKQFKRSHKKNLKYPFCSRQCYKKMAKKFNHNIDHITEKTKWPSDVQLAKLIWKTPVTTLAKKFGVSDKAIKKRCDKRGIKTPPVGYWAKQQALNMPL